MPASVSSLPSHGDLNPPLPHSEYAPTDYYVHINTANLSEAGTDKEVFIRLSGDLAVSKYNRLSSAQSQPLQSQPQHQSQRPSFSSPSGPSPDPNTDHQQTSVQTFHPGTKIEFSFRDVNVGNIIAIDLRHAADADKSAAWKPETITVNNYSLRRTWTFVCTRWLSAQAGNTIRLEPTPLLAVGNRASRRASRRISDKSKFLSPASTESRRRFETVRERFNENGTEDVVSSGTEVGTKRVCFNLQKFTFGNAHMYLTGSVPALGECRQEKACRMMSVGNGADGSRSGKWRLDIEIDDDYDEIEYSYLIIIEGNDRRVFDTGITNTLKLSSYSVERHAEGGPIQINDSFRLTKETQALLSSALYEYSDTHSSSVTATLNARAQLPNAHPASYSLDASSMVDPVSSESSMSAQRIHEEYSNPLDDGEEDADDDSDDGEESVLRDMPHWSADEVEVNASADTHASYHGPTGRSRRRHSDELSSESTSSHIRSATKGMPQTYTNGPAELNKSNEYSPKSSESLTDGQPEPLVDNQSLDMISHEEARQLRSDCEMLRFKAAECDALKHELDNMRLELASTERERNSYLNDLNAYNASSSLDNGPNTSVDEIQELHDQLTTAMAERDAAYEDLNAAKKDREAALENFDIMRQQRDAAVKEAEQVNPAQDAVLIETAVASLKKDHDAVLAERDILAQENLKLNEQLEKTQRAHDEKTKTFSRLSEEHKNMLDDLEQLRAEVIRKREEIDTQAANLNRLLSEKQSELDEQIRVAEKERTALHERWAKEFRERRKLFNTLQELRGNIRVFCRVRPSKGSQSNNVLSFPRDGLDDNGRIQLGGKTFEFDQVFQQTTSQLQVYEETAGVVESVVNGYNVCVFAYGQTGSGKTHTMNGPVDDRGVNYRALQNLFDIAAERSNHADLRITVSMLEIYNENLRDLILPDDKLDSPPKLEIRKDISTGSANAVHVPNLTEVEVHTFEQTWSVMEQGSLNRSKGRTDMNEHSSRSHLVLRVTVWCDDKESGGRTRGVLHLVDLAGSERVSRSNASGDRLKEAQHINKSLSSLGDVFAALVKPNSGHVPYRNSKLTYLLQDCLGGDSKTLMFVNVSGDRSDESETLSSLQFAQRVSKVELGAAKRHAERGADPKALQEAEHQNSELLSKVSTLQRELRKRDEYIVEMKVRARTLEADLTASKESAKQLCAKESSTRDANNKELRDLRAARDRDAAELRAANARIADLERAKDEEVCRLHAIVRSREKEIAGLTVDKSAEDHIRQLQAQLHARDREISELRSNHHQHINSLTTTAKKQGPVMNKIVGIGSTDFRPAPASHLPVAGTPTPASIPGPFSDRPVSVPAALGKPQPVAANGLPMPRRVQRTASSLPGRARVGQQPKRAENDNASSNGSTSGSERSSFDGGVSRGGIAPKLKSSALRNGMLAPPRRAKDAVFTSVHGSNNGRSHSVTRNASSTNAPPANGVPPGASLRHTHASTSSLCLSNTSSSSLPAMLRKNASSSALNGGGGATAAPKNTNNQVSTGTAGVRSQISASRLTRLPRSATTMLRPPQRAVRPQQQQQQQPQQQPQGGAGLRHSTSALGTSSSSGSGSGSGDTTGTSSRLLLPRRAGTMSNVRNVAKSQHPQVN